MVDTNPAASHNKTLQVFFLMLYVTDRIIDPYVSILRKACEAKRAKANHLLFNMLVVIRVTLGKLTAYLISN